MELLRTVIDILMICIGLGSWVMFLPQIRLLWKVKEAKSITLWLVWGSFASQVVVLIHSLLQRDLLLTFAMATSLICLVIVLVMIYYYRKWPGGRGNK